MPSDSGKQGPNTVVHNHAGGTQSNESNGVYSAEFKIKAVLHGQGLQGQLIRLFGALDMQSIGLLKHPYVGSKMCHVIGPYDYHRTDSNSGVIALDITFKEQTAASLGLVAIPAMVSAMAGQVVSGLFSLNNLPQDVKTGLLSPRSFAVMSDSFKQIGSGFAKNFPLAAQVVRAAASVGDASFLPALLNSNKVGGLEVFKKLYFEPFESDYDNAALFSGFKNIDQTITDQLSKVAQFENYTPDLAARKEVLTGLLGLHKAANLVSLSQAVAAKKYSTAEQVQRDRLYLGARQNEYFG